MEKKPDLDEQTRRIAERLLNTPPSIFKLFGLIGFSEMVKCGAGAVFD
jgi:hypothetical protein